METFEQKAMDVFSEIVINKSFVHKAGFGSRAIPTYVREWIISHYLDDDQELSDVAREKIAQFVQRYVPDKSQKESVKNQLFEQMEVRFLDDFSVYVNLEKGDRYLNIPFLDESGAFAIPQIIQDNEMLLSNGLWGVGTLYYIPKQDKKSAGQVWMREFRPFQLANMDLDYFRECRSDFTTSEWVNFLISSMGFNHNLYTERQKILLISRLIPMVEPRYNLVELAPKGTGKSFVFENMSRYVAVRSGSITPAVLFFNDARKTAGLITRYDCVVLDEAQKVKADASGELTALLKSYLEAGRFGRGSASSIAAEAGLVMLANIDLDHNKRPLNEEIGLFRVFPNFLRETAFIDRFSGLLPGWDLPRVSKETPSKSIGLKGDIFGEILHSLRSDISYRDHVKSNLELINCNDMRDSKGIEAGATGLLKIIFPDMNPNEADFYQYCVNPALEYRQRVRDELCKMDREYIPISFRSKYPDNFQRTHKVAKFQDKDKLPDLINTSEKQQLDDWNDDEDRESVDLTYKEFDPKVPKQDTVEEELITKTVHIDDDETGHSYENLFGPYLVGVKEVELIDPYIRSAYQVQNLINFAAILDTTNEGVTLKLTTAAKDAYEERDLSRKYDDIADALSEHNIVFVYEFKQSIHDRSIHLDNGWQIHLGRGLHIFKKLESQFSLGQIDQTKRNCYETDIVFIPSESL